MSNHFDKFLVDYSSRIQVIADWLQDFEIDAAKIGIQNAKSRVIKWIQNFDNIGFADFELPLCLLEKIEFLKSDNISDKIIKDASEFIPKNSSYITHLGEVKESSFKLSAKLHRHPNFCLSLSDLLDKIPNSKGNTILLFDDFLNSGGQVVSIFYALLNKPLPGGEINDEAESRTKLEKGQIAKLKMAEIHLFYYQAFDEGTRKVEQRLKRELGLDIHIHNHYSTNNNDSAFGDREDQEKIIGEASGRICNRSMFQGRKYSELTELYATLKLVGELLLRAKEKQWNEQKCGNRALGYGNLCRVIITDSNVPTVTLTALWQSGTIEFKGKGVDWNELVPRTKKVLTKRNSTTEPKTIEPDYNSIAEELQALYENDEFREGLKKAESYYETYGSHPNLLKHALRFNLRDKNWSRITEIITGLDDSELTDQQRALCRYTLFECALREAYEFRSNATKYSAIIKHIREHLNHVPSSQKNSSEYHYLLGRWHLEMWWAHRRTNNLANLTQAFSSFTHATSIKDTWWIHCYRCIVLKLLNKKEFLSEAELFRARIFDFQQRKPLQPSVKCYCITALILSDGRPDLEVYLKTLNQEMSPTDFEDSLIHRIEMIFDRERAKQVAYKQMVSNWIKSLPRK